MADQLTAGGVPVYRDSGGVLREVLPTLGTASMTSNAMMDRDTDGNEVPTYKAHAYTYDTSGNLFTDSVTNGVSTWVKTYTYQNGVITTDSGWVKQ